LDVMREVVDVTREVVDVTREVVVPKQAVGQELSGILCLRRVRLFYCGSALLTN
jgi:hypothetical protein